MGIAFLWVIFSLVAGAIARFKGLRAHRYIFLSLLLSPIIGIFAAVASKPNYRTLEKRKIKSGKAQKCPFCAEVIKIEAKVCRFCRRELPSN